MASLGNVETCRASHGEDGSTVIEVKTLEDVTIIIDSAPYGVERPGNALRLALVLISASRNSKVNVFLLGDGVSIAKRGQSPPQGYYNLETMVSELVGKRRSCTGLRHMSEVEGTEQGRPSQRHRGGYDDGVGQVGRRESPCTKVLTCEEKRRWPDLPKKENRNHDEH